ncbi:MAG TPA: undecaprenyl-diphosphate phosphatase [Coriobacteriia bacterium]|nr:undecaprenyl-diphosphate phosphatase [Coriobacteriia bacterium]
MDIIELLKALLIGIVEGITEWLPISSTGHMILFNEFVTLNVSPQFWEMFLVVIQLGAILAVIVLFFHKLNPLSSRKDAVQRRSTWVLWLKVLVACVPAAIVGIFFDDWFEEHFFNATTVAIALIGYGIAYIVVERLNDRKEAGASKRIGAHSKNNPLTETDELESLSFPRAILIGVFQCLAIVPGTSRSGSTILGARILGVSRQIAAEFSFFLAIPVMFGWSLLKIVKAFLLDSVTLTVTEWGVFAVGIVTAFVISILAIKFLMGYIKNHSFEVFGWYRIVLGVIVLVFFAVTGALFA